MYFENRAAKAAKFKGKMAAKGKDTHNAFEDDEPAAAAPAAAGVHEAEEAPGMYYHHLLSVTNHYHQSNACRFVCALGCVCLSATW